MIDSTTATADTGRLTLNPKPRGDVRILYTTDTYAIAWYILTDERPEGSAGLQEARGDRAGP